MKRELYVLEGFAIALFLFSMAMTIAMWGKMPNMADPVFWWIAACINAHSIISRLAPRKED